MFISDSFKFFLSIEGLTRSQELHSTMWKSGNFISKTPSTPSLIPPKLFFQQRITEHQLSVKEWSRHWRNSEKNKACSHVTHLLVRRQRQDINKLTNVLDHVCFGKYKQLEDGTVGGCC